MLIAWLCEKALFFTLISSLNSGSLNFLPSFVSVIKLAPRVFHGSGKTTLTLMNSPNHGLLSPGAEHGEIQQGHGTSEDQSNSISCRIFDEGIRSIGRVSNGSEKKEKILNPEICRKNSLLECGKGWHRKGLIADWCHDKTLFKTVNFWMSKLQNFCTPDKVPCPEECRRRGDGRGLRLSKGLKYSVDYPWLPWCLKIAQKWRQSEKLRKRSKGKWQVGGDWRGFRKLRGEEWQSL